MRAAKIDANQPEVVKTLRKAGVSVQHLHAVGGGVPDLLCALPGDFPGLNFLIEIKDGSKSLSAQALTPDQVKWHDAWPAPVYVIRNIEQALELVAKIKANQLSKDLKA